MKLANPVKLGAWLLVGLNLLMAFASIWVFVRMAPAIEVIIDQNEASLEACEQMLAALALKGTSEDDLTIQIDIFRQALERAEGNISQPEEEEVLEIVRANYMQAFLGERLELQRTASALIRLGDINRGAMKLADGKARQLGYGGAWGVVFMATFIFVVGLLFIRGLQKTLADPLIEIDSVVSAYRSGDTIRRCSLDNPSKSIKAVMDNVNELLDKI